MAQKEMLETFFMKQFVRHLIDISFSGMPKKEEIPVVKQQITQTYQEKFVPSFFQPPRKMPQQAPIPKKVTISIPREAINPYSKVISLLSGNDVMGIECTGVGKKILINRSGVIEETQISLNEEDINSILEEVSRKTKIPIIKGVFRAFFSNYLMTAIISEFVGKKFIIQKRNPFMQYRGTSGFRQI